MNPENINKNHPFFLYGWCINYRFFSYSNNIKQKKTKYYVKDVEKIDYSSNLNNKESHSQQAGGYSLSVKNLLILEHTPKQNSLLRIFQSFGCLQLGTNEKYYNKLRSIRPNWSNKFKDSYEKNSKFLATKLKEKEGVLC